MTILAGIEFFTVEVLTRRGLVTVPGCTRELPAGHHVEHFQVFKPSVTTVSARWLGWSLRTRVSLNWHLLVHNDRILALSARICALSSSS
jgi:hypothetical protein